MAAPAALGALFFCALFHAGLTATVRRKFSLSLSLQADGLAAVPTSYQRVVKLLSEMRAQLEQEMTADSESYDKMVCWCETNEKAKTKAIADADEHINELESEIEIFSAREGELGANIESLKKSLAEKKKALVRATAIREKEHAAFNAEENEMVESVTTLKNAIAVLGKNQTGLLQITPAVQESLGAAMRWIALKHEEMLEMDVEGGKTHVDSAKHSSVAALISLAGTSSASVRGTARASQAEETVLHALRERRPSRLEIPTEFAAKVLATAAIQGTSFAQQHEGQAWSPTNHLKMEPTNMQSYSPQSSQILGILKQLLEDFESNLSDAQKTELDAQESFKELQAASLKQIAAETALLDEMEADYSTNTKALSDAKEDLEITHETRAEDVKFLSDLRLKCQDLNNQYKERSRARGEEIKAVADTIAILTEDDARNTFQQQLGTGGSAAFLQLRSVRGMARRHAAAAALLSAARNLGGISDGLSDEAWRLTEDKPHEQLAAMAVSVQIDAFAKVKQAIDDMVVDLKAQQDEEVTRKAFCTGELNDNEKQTYHTQVLLADIEDKISVLEATIEKLTQGIAAAKEEIATTEVQLKKVGEQRKKENDGFKEEVNDQRTMQNLLKKAIHRLGLVYNKGGAAALAQEEPPAPPVHFQPFKQHAGGSGVLAMLEAIIVDSEAVEKDAVTAEQDAQKAYETFLADSTATIKALNESIRSKTNVRAATTVEKEEAEAQHTSTQGRLEDLTEYAVDLHGQCDFVLKNFDIRQTARLQEIEAMQGAKAMLSGMVEDAPAPA